MSNFVSADDLGQGSPADLQPIRNRAAQQEVSGSEQAKLYLPLPSTPHRSHYHLTHTPAKSGENCLPQNRSLVPKRLATADLGSQGRMRTSQTNSLLFGAYIPMKETNH